MLRGQWFADPDWLMRGQNFRGYRFIQMRALGYYFSARFALIPVLEALVLVQSMVLGFQLRLNSESYVDAAGHGLFFGAVMLLVMTAFGLYDRTAAPFRTTVQRVFSSYLVTLSICAVVFYCLPKWTVGRGVFAMASVFAVIGLLIVRLVAHRAAMLQMPTSRVLVVGDGPEAQEVVAFLRIPQGGRVARFTAQVRVSPPCLTAPPDNTLDVEALPRVVKQRRISEIVVALRERRDGQEPLAMLLACKLMGISILDLASFYEREHGLIKLEHLRASWLIYGSGFDQSRLRVLIKRSFDLIASSILLTITSPLMLLAAVAIRLESAGPVLFKQERVRAGGVPFMMLKFRSMRQDAESDGTPRWAAMADDRVTRVGRLIRRLRVDELPQLLNVLKGDMSFVGPRPERPFFVSQLTAEIPYYELRHNVKPGITGWAQVRLQYGASVEDAKLKLQYDLYYVKNHSLFLDLMILFETVQVVLLGKGAR